MALKGVGTLRTFNSSNALNLKTADDFFEILARELLFEADFDSLGFHILEKDFGGFYFQFFATSQILVGVFDILAFHNQIQFILALSANDVHKIRAVGLAENGRNADGAFGNFSVNFHAFDSVQNIGFFQRRIVGDAVVKVLVRHLAAVPEFAHESLRYELFRISFFVVEPSLFNSGAAHFLVAEPSLQMFDFPVVNFLAYVKKRTFVEHHLPALVRKIAQGLVHQRYGHGFLGLDALQEFSVSNRAFHFVIVATGVLHTRYAIFK